VLTAIHVQESAVDEPAAETKDNIQSEKQGTIEVLEASGEGKKRGTFQEPGEEGPTNLGAPRQAAKVIDERRVCISTTLRLSAILGRNSP
jgi:hypothetical protein